MATTKTAATMDVPIEHYSIDFKILRELEEGRLTPAIIGQRLNTNRNYISNRLRDLRQYGMVRRLGEDVNVGLYELTDLGRTALEHSDKWDDDRAEYRRLIEDAAE